MVGAILTTTLERSGEVIGGIDHNLGKIIGQRVTPSADDILELGQYLLEVSKIIVCMTSTNAVELRNILCLLMNSIAVNEGIDERVISDVNVWNSLR